MNSGKRARKSADNAADLRKIIQRDYNQLSKKLKLVAKFVLDNPSIVGFETVTRIADDSGNHPSTIVRFAKEFGFDGASQMQKLFRDELLQQRPVLSYQDRLKEISGSDSNTDSTPHQLLTEFVEGSILSLEHLQATIDPKQLNKAVSLINKSGSVFVTGFRRSFPVALYQYYALNRVNKPCQIIDGLGGIIGDISSNIGKRNLLIATSFHSYAPETSEIVEQCHANGAKIIALTDSEVSPIAAHADVCFLIKDAEVRRFRSLTGPMCLSQAIIIAYGLQSQ